ncbi:hypothetical protein ACIOC1_12830 [Streptomyces sp. NPDC088197]|uniref:hypothetical protein n=1 Tax=Streptomyces sp. NPDC088197 TaxID=3365840 RepID=UPI0038203FC3
MSFAEDRSQAVEDVVHAWTHGTDCLLREADGGSGETVGTETGPRMLSHAEAVQIVHAQLVLIALGADLGRLQTTARTCYRTAVDARLERPEDARAYARAADLCERAARLVVDAGAAGDDRARRRLLAVAEHDTAVATGAVDPEVADRARRVLESALSEAENRGARDTAPQQRGPRYPGPTYDETTGRHRVGVGATGEPAYWQLNTPGSGMESGLICGAPGSGKSSFLLMVLYEAARREEFTLWLADPGGRHDTPAPIAEAAARTAATREQTVDLLRDAVAVIADRARHHGPVPDPTDTWQGIVLAVEDCRLVFADDLEATRLAERVVAVGGRFGVALVVTAPDADLASFGGSLALRAGLARTNCFPLGPGGRQMLTALGRAV